MKSYEIGELHQNDVKTPVKARPLIINPSGGSNSDASWMKWLIPLVIVVIAIVYFKLVAPTTSDANRPPKAI